MENYDINLSGLKNTKDASGILQNCTSVTSVDASQLTSNTKADNMFNGASNLAKVNLGSTRPASATNMFTNTSQNKVIQVADNDTKNWIETNKTTLGLEDGSYTIEGGIPVIPENFTVAYSDLDGYLPYFETKEYTLTITNIPAEAFSIVAPAVTCELHNKLSQITETATLNIIFELPVAVTSLEKLFINLKNIKTINISNTEDIINITSIAEGCTKLSSINLGNTILLSNITKAFFGCERLLNITLDYSKVEIADNAFFNCVSLEAFDTTVFKVLTSAKGIFENCSRLSVIDTLPFANITNADDLLKNTNISTLEYTPFNKVTTANSMLEGTHITQLDLSKFDSLVNGSALVKNCSELSSIILGNVENTLSTFTDMFSGCSAAKVIKVSNSTSVDWLNTNKAVLALDDNYTLDIPSSVIPTDITYEKLDFWLSYFTPGTYNLNITDLPDSALVGELNSKLNSTPTGVYFNLSINISDTCTTAKGCFENNLKILTCTYNGGISIVNTSQMFKGCRSLTEVRHAPVPKALSIDAKTVVESFPAVIDATEMFMGDTALTSIDLNEYPSLETATSMFEGCTELNTIQQESAMASLTTADRMFKDCGKVQSINMTFFPGLTTAVSMFENCKLITEVNLSQQTSLVDATSMLANTTISAIDFTGLTSITNISNILQNNTSLTQINLGNIHSTLITFDNAFSGCSAAKVIKVNSPEQVTWLANNKTILALENYTLDTTGVIIPSSIPYSLLDEWLPQFTESHTTLEITDIPQEVLVGNRNSKEASTLGKKLSTAKPEVLFNLDLVIPSGTTSLEYLFTNIKNIETVAFKGELLGITSMESAFENTNITTTDISQIVNLDSLKNFARNSQLSSFGNIGGLTKVTTLEGAFENTGISQINSRVFTSAKNISNAFKNCKNFINIDTSTCQKVTQAISAFEGSGVTSVDLSPFTGLVDSSSMLKNTSITSAQLSTLKSLVNMSSMFEGCSQLSQIYWTNKNTGLTNITNAFNGASATKNFKVHTASQKEWINTNATQMALASYSVDILPEKIPYNELEIWIPTFVEESLSIYVTDIPDDALIGTFETGSAFDAKLKKIKNAKELHLTIDLSNTITSLDDCFYNNSILTSIKIANPEKLTSIKRAFVKCYGLKNIDLNNFTEVIDATQVFQDCTSLEKIDISGLKKVKKSTQMFLNCSSLIDVDLGTTQDTLDIGFISGMFEGCEAQKIIRVPTEAQKPWVVTHAPTMLLVNYSLEDAPSVIYYKDLDNWISVYTPGEYTFEIRDIPAQALTGDLNTKLLSVEKGVIFNLTIDIPQNTTSMVNCFKDNTILKSLKFKGGNSVTDITSILEGASLLSEVDFSSFTSVITADSAFKNTNISLFNFGNTYSHYESYISMFENNLVEKTLKCDVADQVRLFERNHDIMSLVNYKFSMPDTEIPLKMEYEELYLWAPLFLDKDYTLELLHIPTSEVIGTLDTSSLLNQKLNQASLGTKFNLSFELTNDCTDISYILYNNEKIKSINIISTSLKKANHSFDGCSFLIDVNTTSFNTINEAEAMFRRCSTLEAIDTSNFGQVTNSRAMFQGCTRLEIADLTQFINTLYIDEMFENCNALVKADVSSFIYPTTAVRTFKGCHTLREINLSTFSKITDTTQMFYDCRYLNRITISDMYKSITGFNEMFTSNIPHTITFMVKDVGCRKWLDTNKVALGLGNYNFSIIYNNLSSYVSSITDPGNYDIYIEDIPPLDFKGDQDTSLLGKKLEVKPNIYYNISFELPDECTSMAYCFYNNTAIKNVDIKKYNNLKDIEYIFGNCTSLETYTEKAFEFVIKANGAFSGMPQLTSINTALLSNIEYANSLFEGCSGLTSVNLENFKHLLTAAKILKNCNKITSITNTDCFSSVTDLTEAFYGCTKLGSINTSGFTKASILTGTFENCSSLASCSLEASKYISNTSRTFKGCAKLLKVLGLDAIKVEDASYMFDGDESLNIITDLSTFRNLKNASFMFRSCKSIASMECKPFTKVTDATSMFENCSRIGSIDISRMSAAEHTDDMLSGCTLIDKVFFGNMQFSNKSHFGMFRGVPVKRIYASEDAAKWLRANSQTLFLQLDGLRITSVKAVYTFSRVEEGHKPVGSVDNRLIKGDLEVLGTITASNISGGGSGGNNDNGTWTGTKAQFDVAKTITDKNDPNYIADGDIVNITDDNSMPYDVSSTVNKGNLNPVSSDAVFNYVEQQNPTSLPIGLIFPFAGRTLPEGYLLCDGSTFDSTTYPALAEVLGTNTTPDLKNRFLEGAPTLNDTRNTKEAGLPNLVGSFTIPETETYDVHGTGVFSDGGSYSNGAPWTGVHNGRKVNFDASKGNTDLVYGKSSTVQPASYLVAFIIKAI